MIDIADDKVIISRKTWEELKSDDYIREIIVAIEDREELIKVIEGTEYIEDFGDYHKTRIS